MTAAFFMYSAAFITMSERTKTIVPYAAFATGGGVYVPSFAIAACFMSIALRGTRTWSNRKYPLSTALYPILGPMSPAVTPGIVA